MQKKSNMKKFALVGLGGLMLTVSAASAATVDVIAVNQAARNAVDATKSLDLGGGSWNPSRDPVVGSVGSYWRSPWEGDDAGNANTQYWTIGPSNPPVGSPSYDPNNPNSPNPAILEFTSAQTQLSFLWGSIDTYNEIKFYAQNGDLLATVLGQAALNDVPSPTEGLGAALVRITDIGSFHQGVVFFERLECIRIVEYRSATSAGNPDAALGSSWARLPGKIAGVT